MPGDTFSPDKSLTYSELWLESDAIAQQLSRILAPSERALLLFGSEIDFITHFIACLKAGVIAVPTPLPKVNRKQARIDNIIRDCAPKLIITSQINSELLGSEWSQQVAKYPLETWIFDDQALDSSQLLIAPPQPEQIAFIQYTSGSISAPKGVTISHRNLAANLQMIANAFDLEQRHRFVSWMPFFHDMGLICMLTSLVDGHNFVFFSPESFFIRPLKWLKTISSTDCTISGGPNFAYDYCVRRIKEHQCEGLDLSNWFSAYNGSEKINPKTLDAFVEKFSKYGFSRSAFKPCYGMAECTLMATCSPHSIAPRRIHINRIAAELNSVQIETEHEGSLELVSCGHPTADSDCIVIAPDGVDITQTDQIGEICIAGPHVTKGYWNKPDFSKNHCLQIEREGSAVDYIKTGDLGFMHENHVYITGRQKELIIIAGKNHYPQDIEHIVEAEFESISSMGTAAFSIANASAPSESVILVVELKKNLINDDYCRNLAREIRTSIGKEMEIKINSVVYVAAGGIPKTTSGKKQRLLCKHQYLNDQLDTLDTIDL